MLVFDSESPTVFTMEDLDSRLFIAGVEVSCWQDQLRQAVSINYLSILLNPISSIFILYI